MGDRANIIFTTSYAVSATIYLHWGGHSVPDYINAVRALAEGEELNLGYAAARFVGIAHEDTPGNMSLGVYSTSDDVADAVLARDGDRLTELSPGDAGLVIVSTKDYSWEAYGGYLAEAGSVINEVA